MAPRERPPLTALRVAPAIRLLSLAAVFLLGGCSSDDPPTLLLAVVVDLSGPGREEGLQIRDGARLAVREATRAGAAAPELQLLIQDDRGDPRYAAHLARQLVAIPEVLAVLVAPTSATALSALEALAGEGGLPVLVAGVCSPELREGRPWVFCLAPGPEALGESLAWFLVTELGVRGAAAFFTADPFGEAYDRGFEGEMRRLGGEIVQHVPFDDSVTSFDLYLPEARAAPAVFVAGEPAQADRAVAALRAGGVSAPLLAGAHAATDSGSVYRPALFDPAASAAAREFAARFPRAFRRTPTAGAALAYDGSGLVVRATQASVVERQALVRWLTAVGDATPHAGVTGRFFFSREGEAVRDVAVVSGASGARTTVAPR